tara:strand:+ start:6909 stop:7967 length:1059 start_codon:yes stop_codon:yes gene_type:complete
MGNGPLTDYGRAVGATVISDRILRDASTTDDDIGKSSGFLFMEPMNDWFRPSFDYRGLTLKTNYDELNEENEYIHMMADAAITLRLGPKDNKDKFIMSFTMGYAPTPRALKDNATAKKESNYRTREHYLGWRTNQKWGLYVGLMDKAFGIRVPDHNVFSRSTTGLSMNDQTHGLLVHYTIPEFEYAIHAFVGNLAQEGNIRQTGGSGTFEWTATAKTRIGASVLSSQSDFVKQSLYAAHMRSAFGKGSSVMIEVGQQDKKVVLRDKSTTSRYIFTQNHVRLKRGLNMINTLEYLKADTEKKEDKVLRLGPGLQYFLNQGMELRLDIYNTKVFSETSVSDDSWDVTGQYHIWF